MDFGEISGWVALGFGLLVAPPQLWRMIKTGKSNDVSLMTYVFLFLTMTGYLIHAIHIGAIVFTISNSINLTINGAILILLVKRKLKYG